MSEPTAALFREDAYLAETNANVSAVNERGGIILDRTVFFATGGGQPGDCGQLRIGADKIAIATAVYSEDKRDIVHVPIDGNALPEPGQLVTAKIDWELRHKHMRIHTALHLLSVVIPFPVTGGSIAENAGRLDFDVEGELPDKDAISDALNSLVEGGHPISDEWISDDELLANPALVKTMKVKPPMGTGRVRLIRIGDVDLQPCGGTHVRSTSEIGPLKVGKIESKGRQNRRIRIGFAEELQ